MVYDATSSLDFLTREESFLFLKELDDFIIEQNNLAKNNSWNELSNEECQEILELQIKSCHFSHKHRLCSFIKANSFTSIDILYNYIGLNSEILSKLILTPTAKKYLPKR